MYHAPILYKFLGRLLLLWFRFQDRIPAKLEKESRRYKDLAFVQVYDFENNTVKDSYGHLAFKVYSYLQILVVSHTAWKWVMKVRLQCWPAFLQSFDFFAMNIAKNF